ncbi:hypothetical protein F7734_38970 [Scytonema sp. UIC 10036]|uniref:SBBP repeat-containing protein n=1 Tax=Scytonema sp. UIC 10036 TaxID=2304196 RepID=UPI0012DA1268|nr:SBBP repeat-containing protein [Scytonema sp. UIC 10036]MUG97974.1 hypothetical protein [Scytonema sp. UIC 10036]
MTIDGAGNTLLSAREFNITPTTQTFTDWVGSSDLDDFYRFSLSNSSSFNLALNGLVADADVQLIRDANSNGIIDSGEVIASSTNGSTTAESISRTLDAGTYYTRVYPFNGANTNYNLSVFATINDFAGNTLNNARQITLNSTTSTYTDWVGSSDTDDYYRFSLSANSSVNLALNGLSGNADVQLLDSSGNAIASSTNGGTATESISRILNAGTYYIRVYPYNGANTNYNLNVSATIHDFAGNNLNSARQINLDSVASTYSDWVGSSDTDDYYRFSLGTKSSFNLALNGLVADADVQLIRDANSNGIIDSGEVIASSTNGSTTAESISRTLDAGTYYIRVYPFNGANTNYNLNVFATPDDYAGNTLNNARQITLNSTTSTYTDWVGSADTNDYYRFSLDATSSFNLALNGLSGNADVQLLDSSGNAITSSTNGGTATESISRILNAGTYYIRVYPGNSGASTFYNLSIESDRTWIQQLGTEGDDSCYNVATDNVGNVYITGYTNGELGGTNAGGVDAWVAKYDSNGTLLWTRQMGTGGDEISCGVATDSAGNVYIAGEGNISGNTGFEGTGAWLAKYDTFGNSVWTKQLTSGVFAVSSVATDHLDNVYISGGILTSDFEDINAWVAKYNSSGNFIWDAQEGYSGGLDYSNDLTVDGVGNVYITGRTDASLREGIAGNFNAWVAKYDSNGFNKWRTELGTDAYDDSFGIATDSAGNVYITGETEGALGGTNVGEVDAWVAKYDSSGTLRWTKQLGTSGLDVSYDIATDSIGNFYITGVTDGALGETNAGEVDAWIAKYDSNGNQMSILQLGTSNDDISKNIAIDSANNVYIAGATWAALEGTNAGEIDAWVAKFY